MDKGINVLSLFDGMSCGQIALEKLGIKVNNYYASEIDKYAMKVTKDNYPNTTHIGDVVFVNGINLPKIDLMIAGSPCQGFSFAGKQLNFSDPRSKLFFEFVRLLKECNPKYWMLENVKMKKEHQDVISEYLGCEPVIINSSLVSAQNRVRLYWTNIPGITQPQDKLVLLRDVLEHNDVVFPAAIRGRNLNKATILGRRLDDRGKRQDYNKEVPIVQCLEVRATNRDKSNYITTVAKDTVITNIEIGRHPDIYTKSKKLFNVNPSGKGMNGWVYDPEFKSPTLTTNKGEGTKIFNTESSRKFRTLTPLECERLQTVPDNYTNCVSNSQRYKMLGNGWTIDVIAHIFKGIK